MTKERLEEIIASLPCYIKYKGDGLLWNENTQSTEGIEGDTVEFARYYGGKKLTVRGTVEGYTNYQIINTKEWGTTVLSAEDAREKRIISYGKRVDETDEDLEKLYERIANDEAERRYRYLEIPSIEYSDIVELVKKAFVDGAKWRETLKDKTI